MRTIDRASAFKRDYKRKTKGQHRATLAQRAFRLTAEILAVPAYNPMHEKIPGTKPD